jgi:virginiamycin B lyase
LVLLLALLGCTTNLHAPPLKPTVAYVHAPPDCPASPAHPKGFIEEFPLPPLAGIPYAIMAGPDGNLWFTDPADRIIWQFNPKTQEFTPHGPLAGHPGPITVGPDGALWFTEGTAGVGRITTAGIINEFGPPTPGGSFADGITAGPDGDLWVTDGVTGTIWQINPTTGAPTPHGPPSDGSHPNAIAAGPDHNIWFATDLGVGRINPTTGVISPEYPLPAQVADNLGITAGPDGNVWLTWPDAIGRITPTFVFTPYYVAPPPYPAGKGVVGITTGPDGNIWFSEHGSNQIAWMNPTTGLSTLHQYPPPSANIQPFGITAGPAGLYSCELWFTDTNGKGAIGYIVS